MIDPLVGAVCNPPEIWQMVDEMLVAQAEWLPQYEQAIAEAKHRLENEPLLPTKDYEGAARLKVKSVDEMRENRQAANKNASAADKAIERPAADE